MRIMNKEDIITALKEAVVPDEEYYIDSEIINAMLEYSDPFEFVEPILDIISENPSVDFGSPGELVHFVEKFYKKGYEEALIASVRKSPTFHNIWMIHRCYNDANSPFHNDFLTLINEIKESNSTSADIKKVIEMFNL